MQARKNTQDTLISQNTRQKIFAESLISSHTKPDTTYIDTCSNQARKPVKDNQRQVALTCYPIPMLCKDIGRDSKNEPNLETGSMLGQLLSRCPFNT